MLYIFLDFGYINRNYPSFFAKGVRVVDIKRNIERLLSYKAEKLFFYGSVKKVMQKGGVMVLPI